MNELINLLAAHYHCKPQDVQLFKTELPNFYRFTIKDIITERDGMYIETDVRDERYDLNTGVLIRHKEDYCGSLQYQKKTEAQRKADAARKQAWRDHVTKGTPAPAPYDDREHEKYFK